MWGLAGRHEEDSFKNTCCESALAHKPVSGLSSVTWQIVVSCLQMGGFLGPDGVTNQGSWLEARQEIQARLSWGPCSCRGKREQVSFPCLPPPRVRVSFPHLHKFLMCSGGRGVARGVLPTPWVMMCARGSHSIFCSWHCFVPGSSKVAVGFFVSLYLWGPEFAPTAHVRSYF